MFTNNVYRRIRNETKSSSSIQSKYRYCTLSAVVYYFLFFLKRLLRRNCSRGAPLVKSLLRNAIYRLRRTKYTQKHCRFTSHYTCLSLLMNRCVQTVSRARIIVLAYRFVCDSRINTIRSVYIHFAPPLLLQVAMHVY